MQVILIFFLDMRNVPIRLSNSPSEGFIEIKNGSTWTKVDEKKWDENRQKNLCQHLGLEINANNNLENRTIESGEIISTGDVNLGICDNISCCALFVSTTSNSTTKLPYVKCGRFD